MIPSLLLLSTLTADSRYPLMGEYVFATPISGAVGSRLSGVQVRPVPDLMGEVQYEIVVYPGGLPGMGWDGGATERRDPAGPAATDAFLRAKRATRVDRTSSTMALKAPAEAVVLFDATEPNLGHWAPGAALKEGYLLAGAETKADFGDARIHLEFLIPLQPDKLDTWRGNSGVYVQNRYEVQVLESFGDIIRDNGAGSIYRIHTPPQNMALPPGRWQTLDIDFTAARFDGTGDDAAKTAPARMTVWLNGVTLFDDVEVPDVTNGNKLPESPADGPLHLQDHGDPVVYRNVWLVPKGGDDE